MRVTYNLFQDGYSSKLIIVVHACFAFIQCLIVVHNIKQLHTLRKLIRNNRIKGWHRRWAKHSLNMSCCCSFLIRFVDFNRWISCTILFAFFAYFKSNQKSDNSCKCQWRKKTFFRSSSALGLLFDFLFSRTWHKRNGGSLNIMRLCAMSNERLPNKKNERERERRRSFWWSSLSVTKKEEDKSFHHHHRLNC